MSAAELKGHFPGPMFEVEFWNTKRENMQNVHDQLNGEKCVAVVKLLQKYNSTYVAGFLSVMDELNAGLSLIHL